MSLSDAVMRELASLRADDKLTAFHVLDAARDPNSALHAHFEWNDGAAARAYRYEQAERLIVRAKVRIIPREDDGPRVIRAVLEPIAAAAPVSAPAAAPSAEPSRMPVQPQAALLPAYASTASAASTPRPAAAKRGRPAFEDDEVVRERRPENDAHVDALGAFVLLREALAELVGIRRRYAHLPELSSVFAGIDQLAQRVVAVAPLEKAAELARTFMDRDGLDRQAAAERAAAAYRVSRWDVLEALRQRVAS